MDESISLQKLLDEPKGKTEYFPDQAFMLHVFWEAPSHDAAEAILTALRACGHATHRDTPCVPTYFFRIVGPSSSVPKQVHEHVQLNAALQKLKVGIPYAAVEADWKQRGFDPELLKLEHDDDLPEAAQKQPVLIEIIEIYLDQRSFFEHSGSRDYLDAYGTIMKPGNMNWQKTTRLGTPTERIIDTILTPILKETVFELPRNCSVWHKPQLADSTKIIVSLDSELGLDDVSANTPDHFSANCSSCLVFPNSLKPDKTHIICVLPSSKEMDGLKEFIVSTSAKGSAFCEASALSAIQEHLDRLGLNSVLHLQAEGYAGYILHERILEVVEVSGT